MFKIDRASWIIISLVGALLLSMWAIFNRPDEAPSWPDTIEGVSFSPFRAGQSPQKTDYPSEEQISRDLLLLSDRVKGVRTYSMEETLSAIPRLAAPLGMKVTVGVWISADIDRNWKEIGTLRRVLAEDTNNITGIVVGNEVLLRNEITARQLSNYVDIVRSMANGIPVTVAETWDVWLKNPELADHVDYVTAHVLPYWEGIPVGIAHDYVFERYDNLRKTFPYKPLVLGEVGWPSEGRQRGGAIPSMQNQAKFLRKFLQGAESRGANYFVLEAFDQIWKTDEGAVGRYWGIFNAEREPKFPFADPVRPVPEWRAIAGFSLAFTVLILALLLRDSRGLVHGGRGFLVIVSYAISMAVVWMVYDYSQKYMTWEQVLVGAGLLLAAFCITIVLLAEAHEWAETIWSRSHRRVEGHPEGVEGSSPKVSIHVPIHNEPPDMVIETLAALRDLNYSNYEVIVVDNNTNDDDCWQPVQQWCEQQEGSFFFHHVNPLSGFKAGALNYAMRHTATDAELIAVIDSDYIVDPDWLKDCTIAFEDNEIAIVQAPQDYRDAGDSLFKSMIYAEYAGFFGIGMVNRDARNAIIQHGTMTIVRRSVLENVDGWSEWCITEDAELGLRILEQGHRTAYLPHSYGRGVMPDNFLDYKKQRFRWAYGSVLILRHHMRYFLSLSRSKLTSGQRYHFVAGWLPWMADGLCLMFNIVALAYSVLMVMFPYVFNPPEVIMTLLPIGFFVFKLSKMMVLYRWRLRANIMQSLGAGLAGLSVSHTIARAMLAGLHTTSIGFFRTPKMADGHSLWQAILDVREEALIGLALILAAITIGARDDAYLTDTKLWIALLLIQSIPYVSAVAISMISTFEKLPTRLFNDKPEDSLLGRLSETVARADR
ncbi:glycosyltransferase [Granulosicoccus antarcticus]|uniref:Beta-monoglucosyldiacylglycerol synthase n=1 Tax=Granulosicoccus antarcticus IMCC3135 TaxID=1192854 RepID=A0A2Z2NZ01_9GAMM|nr:glycosyltransferase [Granulosicoccus antarcticus]ASJ76543.1 Cellulose synthase catalytic subunit (UDP-forming) [Granulosicoccus antarcticus IMCC3135]